MTATFHHTLKGIPGWSSLSIQTVDVRKVLEMEWAHRLFMLRDRDHPLTLRIKYLDPHSEANVTPVFVGGKMGISVTDSYVQDSIITKRYRTEQDLMNDFREIERLKKIIASYDDIEQKRLQEFAKKTSSH